MEHSRLQEEKLRVQTKEKKDQSNSFVFDFTFVQLNIYSVQVLMPRLK